MDSREVPVSAGAAAWVVAGLRGFGESVVSVVPAGFAAYARIPHPAYQAGRPVRWADVAAANGKRTSPTMQWCALTGSHGPAGPGQRAVFDEAPRIGALPPRTARAVAAVLGRHTATPDRCWFAVWDGWSGLPDPVVRAPAFAAPNRRYHLLPGPIGSILAWEQPANLWWPEDRAWCVATEIDLDSTYLGASRPCVNDLLANPDLECLPADPGDRIGYDADPNNPAAPHGPGVPPVPP